MRRPRAARDQAEAGYLSMFSILDPSAAPVDSTRTTLSA
jgi:hypothetical protein